MALSSLSLINSYLHNLGGTVEIPPTHTNFNFPLDLGPFTANTQNFSGFGTFKVSSSGYNSHNGKSLHYLFDLNNDTDASSLFSGAHGYGYNEFENYITVSRAPYNSTTQWYIGYENYPGAKYRRTVVSGNNVDGEWVQIDYPYDVALQQIQLRPRDNTHPSYSSRRLPMIHTWAGSNNNTTWNLIGQATTDYSSINPGDFINYNFNDTNKYRYIRMIIERVQTNSSLAGSGDMWDFSELRLIINQWVP